MNICLIDEDILLGDALRILLQLMPEVGEVDVFSSGHDYLMHRAGYPTDILILTNSGTHEDLLEACRDSAPAEMKIIAFTGHNELGAIKQMIKRGANAVLSKAANYDELLLAIFQVSDGKQYIGKALQENLIHSVFSDQHEEHHLSPREKEVLHKVCSGQTMKEIAYDLKLSVHTVQYYHRSVMDKLKVKRTTDLILYAIQHRLYVPEHR